MELREPIPVTTPLGDGYVLFIEAGYHETYFVCVMNDTGAFVTFKQKEVRCKRNYSLGIGGMTHETMGRIINGTGK